MPTTPPPRCRAQRVGLIEQDGHHNTVLVVLDMISCSRFPVGGALQIQAAQLAPYSAHLKRRCHDAGKPLIFATTTAASDDRIEFVVEESLSGDSLGADHTRQLEPSPDEYFVLKPMHSAFFATPLEILLDHVRALAASTGLCWNGTATSPSTPREPTGAECT